VIDGARVELQEVARRLGIAHQQLAAAGHQLAAAAGRLQQLTAVVAGEPVPAETAELPAPAAPVSVPPLQQQIDSIGRQLVDELAAAQAQLDRVRTNARVMDLYLGRRSDAPPPWRLSAVPHTRSCI